MKVIFAAFVAAVSVLLVASTSFGQLTSGIPLVNFVCLEAEPLIDIVRVTHEKGPKVGGEKVNEYVENSECWYVNPTPVEVIRILQENFDPEGRLWAIAAVKPHESAGFTQRLLRYAILDAAIAKAYLTRHNTT